MLLFGVCVALCHLVHFPDKCPGMGGQATLSMPRVGGVSLCTISLHWEEEEENTWPACSFLFKTVGNYTPQFPFTLDHGGPSFTHLSGEKGRESRTGREAGR